MRPLATSVLMVWVSACGCGSTPPAQPNCPTGQNACGAECAALVENDRHCGACDAACGATESCAASQCYPDDCVMADCAASQVCPAGKCVEKACVGVLCPTGQGCLGGLCIPQSCSNLTCPAGHVCVNDACVDAACLGVLCPSGQVCSQGACQSGNCSDGLASTGETDVDCGGACPRKCEVGRLCGTGADCATNVCTASRCAPPSTCANGSKDGTETDIDCGGGCPDLCRAGQLCMQASDCTTGLCPAGQCVLPGNCTDSVKNGTETDVDCGGSCTRKCGANKLCGTPSDCASGVCTAQHCVGEPSCVDGMKNQDEVDTDCGGSMCLPCADGRACNVPADCLNGFCNASMQCSRGFPMRDVYTPVTATNIMIACGRLNADAYADLVLAGQQLALMLATPSGAFPPAAPIPGAALVAGPADLQVLDIDKDGRLDIVAPFYNNGGNGSTHVAVLRGNGNGTFGAVIDSIYSASLYPGTGRIGVADLNGDTRLDLVVPYSSGSTSGPAVMLGNGAGGFAPAVVYGGVSNANPIRACVAADLDGDGVADVATVHSGQGAVPGVVHFFANTDGGALTVQASTYPTGVGSVYEAVTAVLVDGGTNDIVIGTYGPTSAVNVLRHGTGYNFTQTNYQAGYVYGTAVADVNSDSSLDIVVASDNNILLLLGDGRGNFNAGPNVLMSGTGDIAVCDFNGDGRPDIAQLTSSQVNVFINR